MAKRLAPTPVRKPGESRNRTSPRNGAASSSEWFTVAEAAELLEVNSSRIFDGIRDGKLRVRFRAATPGAGERPLVSSDELCQRSRDRQAPVPQMAAVDPGVAEASAEPALAPSSVEGSESALIAGEEDLESEEQAGSGAASAAKGRASKATTRKAATTRSTKASRDLDEVREARKDAEKALDRESRRRRELEVRVEEWVEEREEQQRTRMSLVGQVQEHKRRASDLDRDLAAARRQLDMAEDRIEVALKAVYERDVAVARLEAQLEASSQVREAGEEYLTQLQSRLTRVEDRSEDKEREIRQLALGLGEARGEIRLLRPPVDGASPARSRAWIPWVGALAIGVGVAWLYQALAGSGSVEGGIVVVVGVFVAFSLGRRRSGLGSGR